MGQQQMPDEPMAVMRAAGGTLTNQAGRAGDTVRISRVWQKLAGTRCPKPNSLMPAPASTRCQPLPAD
jgi:hypothetical protein